MPSLKTANNNRFECWLLSATSKKLRGVPKDAESVDRLIDKKGRPRGRREFGKVGRFDVVKMMMLKIIFVLLVIIELALVPLMIVCLSGVNILLPGLGLVIAGGVVFVGLLMLEAILILATLVLYRFIRRTEKYH